MRITKPRNWHLYTPEMKQKWWKENGDQINKDIAEAQKQLKEYMESGKVKETKIDF